MRRALTRREYGADMAGRVPGRAIGAVCVALAVLATSGCVGDTTRSEFDAIIAERSKGIPASLPGRAFDALEERLGVSSISLRSVDIDDQRAVLLVVRVPDTDDELDSYTYADGKLGDPNPMPTSIEDTLETDTFQPEQVPALDDVSILVERALEELDIADAAFEDFAVRRNPATGVELLVEAASERRSGQVRFDADGDVVEVTFD